MKHLLLIRHGEMTPEFIGRYIGQTDAGLSDDARRTCSGLADGKAVPDRIYSSPLVRALESARLIFPKREILTDSRLMEIHFGDFEGCTFAEIAAKASPEWLKIWAEHPEKVRFPHGESAAEFYGRVDEFFDTLPENGVTALVTHGGVLARVLGRKQGLPPCRWGEVLPPRGSLTEVWL